MIAVVVTLSRCGQNGRKTRHSRVNDNAVKNYVTRTVNLGRYET